MIASCHTLTSAFYDTTPYGTTGGYPVYFYPAVFTFPGADNKKRPMHKPVPLAMQGRLLMKRKVKLYPRLRLPSRRNRNLQQQ